MKKSIYLLAIGFVFLLSSCVDDEYFHGNGVNPPPPANEGYVYFDGIELPITYADIYRVSTLNDGTEIWNLELSENFIGNGTTYTDAFFVIEFAVDQNAPVEGYYDFASLTRPITWSSYLEDVVLFNGNVEDFGFAIYDEEIAGGDMRIVGFSDGSYRIEVDFVTIDNLPLTAYFRGFLRY